jgi:hypothetical protein
MQDVPLPAGSPIVTLFPSRNAPKSVCAVAGTKQSETVLLGLLASLGIGREGPASAKRKSDAKKAPAVRCVSATLSADAVGLLRELEAPCLILASEDLAARAARIRNEEALIGRQSLASALSSALENEKLLLDHASAAKIPTLLVSTEAALHAPAEARHGLAEFLHLDMPAAAPAATSELPATLLASLLEEAERLSVAGYPDDISAAESLYPRAAKALQAGEHEEAKGVAFSILSIFANTYPSLAEGPVGVLSEDAFGIGPEKIYPDHVCAAYFLLGFSDFMLGNYIQAHVYLSSAERMTRRRIELELYGPLSRSAYWNAVLYAGLAARTLQRADLVAAARDRIARASSPDTSEDYAQFHTKELEGVAAVAAVEFGDKR